MDNATIEVRALTIADFQELKDSMIEAYASMGGQYWGESSLEKLLKKFPEGQICVTLNGKVVGCALTLIVNFNRFGDNHSYRQVTGNFTFDTHDPQGDVLYGIEMFINPESRGLRLARRLYDARKTLCEKLNLRAIVAGGRIPGYGKHADNMTPREYIEKVRTRKLHDSTLSFQLANDFQIKKVLRDYLPEDNESRGYATLLVWYNVFYEPNSGKIGLRKDFVRIGVVQWQMRQYKTLEDLLGQVEYFVDAVSDYSSDFVVLPEFFNAPLMEPFNHLPGHAAIRELAKYTPDIVAALSKFAISYNVNIIGGSMPEEREGDLYNTSYFLHRNGKIDKYDKIHPTPSEEYEWAIKGGDKVQVIETDAGKVGVLICYDVEFPELARLLAEQGMQILFVPFLTDTQNAYNRVRYCAAARAIENECFVAIAGTVGNLPKVHNMDLQFAQSAVLTPSDFAFPVNGIKAEATPNTEMIVISDVDLTLLAELHEYGSVTTMKDRRLDLYELKLIKGESKKE
ncbi:carbon-nitrogen hydrolase family protein [Flavihumibacter sp.]|uniref:carbon-nitrogen hydrolase family protein n=1 Tax=Flavihumibacter sp. TaxID=1913981 RepID=UPI002FC951E7|nr:carbon-nitrogen hydrolase family protein [Flavihumibacter sediminis]